MKLGLEDNKVIIEASKKEIVDERRFLVVGRKIVDSTRYLSSPKNDGFYQSAKLLLENILHNPRVFISDRAFTVDMGKANNEIGVIEVNSFSCANLYEMNMDKVVLAINQLIIDVYRENNKD